MDKISVNRTDILKRIKANRDEHVKIVKEAQLGYKKAVIEELEKMVKEAKKCKNIKQLRTNVGLYPPQDHTSDYDAIIDMLECEVADVVEITQQAFRSYVRDEWNWKGQFLLQNAAYSATASSYMATLDDND